MPPALRTLWDGQLTFHSKRGFSAKKRFIPFRSNYREAPVIYSTFKDYSREFFLRFGELLSRCYTSNIQKSLLNELLLSGLYSEVSLSKCDFSFGWVTVLAD